MTILEHKDWKKALRTSHPVLDNHGTLVPETPLRMLIKTYPDLAEVVFNNCVIQRSLFQQHVLDPLHSAKDTLIMNYEFIDDAFLIRESETSDQFFKYCYVNEKDECDMFTKSYSKNTKVVMDNHPLMIMAREEQRVLQSSFY